jgi:hypothetical protein
MDLIDWLEDPLMVIKRDSEYLQPTKADKDAFESWQSFHYNTRLKLNGVEYFLTQAMGAVSRPDDLGLPLLSYSFQQWYLDAFFTELMSAYESLLQELNAIYKCGIEMSDRHLLSKLQKKLPGDLVEMRLAEREKDWFKKVCWYRNSITHRFRTPIDSMKAGSGDKNWHFDEHSVDIYYYNEDAKEWKSENIDVCGKYFSRMLDFVNAVWVKVKEQLFQDTSEKPAKLPPIPTDK